jgi:hypothetical protein
MDWTQLITNVGPLGAIALFVLMRLEKSLLAMRDELVAVRLEVSKLSGKMDGRSPRAGEREEAERANA